MTVHTEIGNPLYPSRVKTRRGVSGPKMDLVCEPDVSGKKEDVGPPVFPWTCCESLSEGGTVTGGSREAL